MRSADAIRSMRVMAAERGIIVGLRDAHFVLNSVGIKPVKENGVVDRAGSYPSTAVSGDTDVISGSAGDMACGLVD
jgi:hypothetical protein